MTYNYDQFKTLYNQLDNEQKKSFIMKHKDNETVKRFAGDYLNEINNQNGQNQNNFGDMRKQEEKTEKQFDPNEMFDSSSLNNPNAKVQIQAGKGATTGLPDYQDTSDTRMQEITNNLNSYWNTNREFFSNRETFNKMFNYENRNIEQKTLLDSYWKKADDRNKASQYTSAEGLNEGINNFDITPDQMDYIKNNNPQLYQSFQDKIQEQIKLHIANMTVPSDPTDTATLLQNLVGKLNIEAGVPFDFVQRREDALDRYGITKDSNRMMNLQNQMYNTYERIRQLESKIRGESAGDSEQLIQARIAKATSSLYGRAQALQYGYNTILQGRNQNVAIASQDLQAYYQQTVEEQRIFKNKLSSLGFAMETANYRTPEQQAQLQLQTQMIQGDIMLYNQARSAQLQSQLNSELTDLSVKDPKQLRANLNNVLSQYYDQYGMMIQRSQSQVVDDVLAYAEKNGVSVAQALSENFIKPLQSKPQYKAMVNKSTGYDPNTNQQERQYIQNSDGSVSLRVSGYGDIPADAFKTRESRQNAYEDVYNYTGGDWQDYVQCLSDSIQNGSYGGQCGAFVNDVLKAGGADKVFGDSLSDKIKACNEEEPQVGYAVVFDFQKSSSDGINHGHVGIVTKVNADGSLEVLESNYNGKGEIRTQTYSAKTVDWAVKGYYKPTTYDNVSNNPRETASTSKTGTIVHTQRGDYDEQYETYFSKWNSDTEGKKLTDADMKYVREKLGNSFDSQLYAYTKQQESKGSQNALNVLRTIQEFENLGGRSYWTDWTTGGNAKRKFEQLKKQLQLQELFNAKENGATFGAMSDSEWEILGNASTSLKWSQRTGFNSELEDIKQALRSAAFGNNNYSKENWQAYKDAHPLASEATSGGQSNVQTNEPKYNW